MHPALSKFSSNHFYEGRVKNGYTADERTSVEVARFAWPDVKNPQFFWHIEGEEEKDGISWFNRFVEYSSSLKFWAFKVIFKRHMFLNTVFIEDFFLQGGSVSYR
jgi:hypothetical protein